MQINDADVAELVDARDLKSHVAAENIDLSCKTVSAAPADMAGNPARLQNNFNLPFLINALARARRAHPAPHLVSTLIEQCKNFERNPDAMRLRILATIERIEAA